MGLSGCLWEYKIGQRERTVGCNKDWRRAFQQKELLMKKVPVFVLAIVGLALVSPVLGETIKLQIKGAY